MKASFVSLFMISSLLFGAYAVPAVYVERRQDADVFSIVETLYNDIKQYTGAINSTANGITASSSAADNSTAALEFQDAVASITSAVTAATKQISALSVASNRLVVRQAKDAGALAALVFNLLLEISGALNNIIATLGLQSLLGFLSPLVSSLSSLLLALDQVVDQLLALVKQLVDGLLLGLSAALSGLIL